MKKFTLLIFAALMMVCGKAWAHDFERVTYGIDGQLPDGVYQIVLYNNHSLCWDVTSGSTNPGAEIQLWTRFEYPQKSDYNNAQLFEVKHIKTEGTSDAGDPATGTKDRKHFFYSIRNIKSGLYVDMRGGSKDQGTNIQQWDGDGDDKNLSQMWEIRNAGGGGFLICSYLVSDDGWQPRVGSYSEAEGQKLLSTYYEPGAIIPSDQTKSYVSRWDFIRIADSADDPAAQNQNVAKIDKIKSDVWYRIAPVTDPAKTIDAAGGSFENETNIHLWQYVGGDNQKWQIEYVTSGDFADRGYYTFKAKGTNSGGNAPYINTSGSRNQPNPEDASKHDNYKVHLWGVKDNNSKWLIKDHGDGTYSFYSVNGVCMDVVDNNMKNGANVQGHRPNSTNAQKFQLIQVSGSGADSPADGLYSIRSAKDLSLCLDESGGGTGEGAGIVLWTHDDEKKHQQWYIQDVGDNNHRIIEHKGSKNAGSIGTPTSEIRVMEAEGANPTSGAAVKEWQWNTGDNQKWFFSYAGDVQHNGQTYKSYYIVNVKNAYYLDVTGGIFEHDTPLHLWEPNATDAQKFVLIPATVDKSISKFDYSTMYYGDLNLRLPDNVEGRTMKLNADGMSVSANATYAPGSIVPQGEGVVLHKTESSGTKKTYKFSVVEDWNASVPKKDSENCLKGSDDETHEVFADQEADPAHSERCFVYRLTKPLDEHGTELDDPFGFYMTPPTVVGGTRYETGKYLESQKHLCYLLAKFHAGKMANNNYPNYVSLEVFDDEETDIQALPEATNYKLQTTDEIYNLAGQRLQKMQKGINIVNGKKVMVK